MLFEKIHILMMTVSLDFVETVIYIRYWRYLDDAPPNCVNRTANKSVSVCIVLKSKSFPSLYY